MSDETQASSAETPDDVLPCASAVGMAAPAGQDLGQLEESGKEYPRIVSALRHRDFRLFWWGNFGSNIGTWMQNVAQGWLVLQLTNSAFWLGFIGFASSIPMLFFTLFGGVIADRMSKRRLLIYTQTSMMVFAFAMAALTYLKWISVWQIALLAFFTGVAMALNAPAYQAMMPQLVPIEDLSNAIALNSAQFNLSRILGPTLGGYAMALVGIAGNFLLNALSFLAVLVALVKIKYPPQTVQQQATFYEKLREGFVYVKQHPQLRAIVVLISVSSFFGIPYVTFVPFFAKNVLHVGERGLGLLMAFAGFGAFLGAATIAWFGNMRHRGRVVVTFGLLFYAGIIGFALSRWFLVSCALEVIVGYAMILMVATLNTLVQNLSSDEMRGRVMSIYVTAFLGFPPVGGLIAGAAANHITVPYTIAFMAFVAGVYFLVFYLKTPALQELD